VIRVIRVSRVIPPSLCFCSVTTASVRFVNVVKSLIATSADRRLVPLGPQSIYGNYGRAEPLTRGHARTSHAASPCCLDLWNASVGV